MLSIAISSYYDSSVIIVPKQNAYFAMFLFGIEKNLSTAIRGQTTDFKQPRFSVGALLRQPQHSFHTSAALTLCIHGRIW
jgi:hypothetical protein